MKYICPVLLFVFCVFLCAASPPLDTETIFKGVVKIDIHHVERGIVQGGSGVCIKKEGGVTEILTAGHVITTPEGFYAVSAWQFYPITRPYTCIVLKKEFQVSDMERDFALLRVKCENNIEPLKVATELPKVGDILYTVGCAHSEWVDMSLAYCTAINKNSIKFSPPAHPGDSGGALINTKGEVVGLIILGGERQGTAQFAKNVLEQIKEK